MVAICAYGLYALPVSFDVPLESFKHLPREVAILRYGRIVAESFYAVSAGRIRLHLSKSGDKIYPWFLTDNGDWICGTEMVSLVFDIIREKLHKITRSGVAATIFDQLSSPGGRTRCLSFCFTERKELEVREIPREIAKDNRRENGVYYAGNTRTKYPPSLDIDLALDKRIRDIVKCIRNAQYASSDIKRERDNFLDVMRVERNVANNGIEITSFFKPKPQSEHTVSPPQGEHMVSKPRLVVIHNDNDAKGHRREAKYVYMISNASDPEVKIGKHTGSLYSLRCRYNTHRTDVYSIHAFETHNNILAEKSLHTMLDSFGLRENRRVEKFRNVQKSHDIFVNAIQCIGV